MTIDMVTSVADRLRHDWQRSELCELFDMPFSELIYTAQLVHRHNFDPNEIQISTLLSIKTGACSEDCGYCPQSGHHATEVERERLLALDEVLERAAAAKAAGASRFCMGAAWRAPNPEQFTLVVEMVRGVKELGLESCLTLGMLTQQQAQELHAAGLDYYNHNLDTSPEFYSQIITTRSYADRLETLSSVRAVGLKVCCGGIVGMGESREDRIGLLTELANLPQHPESVPINHLVKVPGTPLADAPDLDPLEFVRTIAVARIIMPLSQVRLSAGRETMSDELQALCFQAGANSIFYGERLLTAGNSSTERDRDLFSRLGLKPIVRQEHDHSGGTDSGPTLYGNACVSESTH